MMILVTGGAGLIGTRLCEVLLEEGHHVVCLDDLSTGTLENIRHLTHSEKFRFKFHDVCDPLPPMLGLEEVYHLACPASPTKYSLNPTRTIRTCVEGTNNVLRKARHSKARFLLASTSEVYGEPAVHPQPEWYRGNVSTTGPRSCYDEGKRCAEALVACSGVDYRIARIFNTYGPGMQNDDGRVVSNFVRDALKGDPLTVFGNGSQTRSFCYVDDTVTGLICLMRGQVTGPANIGGPHEMSMLGPAQAVLRAAGSSSPISFHGLPTDDPSRRCPNVELISSLGWKPTVELSEGLGRVVEAFRARCV